MTRRKANELGLKILAKHVTTSVAGLAPRIMGIGPTIAIPKALKQAGITIDDVDLFEVCCQFHILAALIVSSRSMKHLPQCMYIVYAN